MTRPFLKMNGVGNAFAVVDARQEPFTPSPEQIQKWADRETGVGFDQLIGLEKSVDGDVFMRVWNADGGMVETCGNALRCVGKLLLEETGAPAVTIEIVGGFVSALPGPDGLISVDMGAPRLKWDEVPLAENMDTRGIELQVGPIDDPILHTPGALSMGNPHVVFFVADAETAPVVSVGSLIERHPMFPEGVNVGFAQIKARDHIRLKVWERGAGLTLACGTGACAALVAAARRGLTGRTARLEMDGGDLTVTWRETDGRVIMSGPVELEYAGVLP